MRIFRLSRQPRNVILFAPTFRDNNIAKDDRPLLQRLFGYDEVLAPLSAILKQHDAIIVVKLHKFFDEYIDMEKDLCARSEYLDENNIVVFWDEVQVEERITIYHLFSSSTAMIADYSSISFDYLLVDKPIIYNNYDQAGYEEYRGFSIEPADAVMPGRIVRTKEDFLSAIADVLAGEDSHSESRAFVSALVNKYNDRMNRQRIAETF